MIYSIQYGGKSKPEVHVIELQTFINILCQEGDIKCLSKGVGIRIVTNSMILLTD